MARPEDIRSSARAARRTLGAAERLDADRVICAALLGVLEGRASGTVATYLPTDGEVDLTAAATTLRDRGWQLLLPVVRRAATMHFARWDERTELVPNRFGIAEPHSDSATVAVSDLDVVVLPCVAVDPEGHRVGFGAGYYDRALEGADELLRLGVAYDVQVAERIDVRPWDVPLDIVITESRVLRCAD